jgi:hypothetical protein
MLQRPSLTTTATNVLTKKSLVGLAPENAQKERKKERKKDWGKCT